MATRREQIEAMWQRLYVLSERNDDLGFLANLVKEILIEKEEQTSYLQEQREREV